MSYELAFGYATIVAVIVLTRVWVLGYPKAAIAFAWLSGATTEFLFQSTWGTIVSIAAIVMFLVLVKKRADAPAAEIER